MWSVIINDFGFCYILNVCVSCPAVEMWPILSEIFRTYDIYIYTVDYAVSRTFAKKMIDISNYFFVLQGVRDIERHLYIYIYIYIYIKLNWTSVHCELKKIINSFLKLGVCLNMLGFNCADLDGTVPISRCRHGDPIHCAWERERIGLL